MNRPILLAFTLSFGLVACAKSKDAAAPKGAASAPSKAAPTPAKQAAEPSAELLNPSKANATAPAKFVVKLETTKGDIMIDVDRSWAPEGADRVYNLVKIGFYDDVAFFRVIKGFMAQIGIHGNPKVASVWRDARIKDDAVKGTNSPGMVSFATAGPNTRTTQFFINLGNNGRLDGMGFAPFGKVRDMKPVKALYSGYGEGAPRGGGPAQGLLQSQGNAYLKASFPELDYIIKATIVAE